MVFQLDKCHPSADYDPLTPRLLFSPCVQNKGLDKRYKVQFADILTGFFESPKTTSSGGMIRQPGAAVAPSDTFAEKQNAKQRLLKYTGASFNILSY
jgi:hypothetical protein